MASLNVRSTTESSVTVYLAGLDPAYTRNDRTCKWYMNGYLWTSTSLAGGITTGPNVTLSQLESETRYTVTVSVTGPGWASPVELTTTATTGKKKITVPQWSWTESNGIASAEATQTAYNAVTKNGKLTDFSYLVWNDMVKKVQAILNAIGDSWSNKYTSYDGTLMSPSDKTLTATRFNALRQNIGSHYSTGIYEVSTGDTVYGYYFTTLANCINQWIAKL